VAERYPPELQDLLIEDPLDPSALAAQLRRWRVDAPTLGALRAARYRHDTEKQRVVL
jgi:hypothetical protein